MAQKLGFTVGIVNEMPGNLVDAIEFIADVNVEISDARAASCAICFA